MTKKTTVVVDERTMHLIAAAAICVSGNVLARLYEKGLLDEADLEIVLARVSETGVDDPAISAFTRIMADTLRVTLKISPRN